MSVSYQYSIIGNVASQVINANNLHSDIKNNLTLSSSTFLGICANGDDLYILFTEEITVGEKTDLDAIVYNHDNTFVPQKTAPPIRVYPSNPAISNVYYTSSGCFTYQGTNVVNPITAIDMLSNVDPGTQSYDVQIINRQNNSIIAEKNFTNTTLDRVSFDTISNLPSDLGVIEILCKVNKNGKATKYVHIEEILFWLD